MQSNTNTVDGILSPLDHFRLFSTWSPFHIRSTFSGGNTHSSMWGYCVSSGLHFTSTVAHVSRLFCGTQLLSDPYFDLSQNCCYIWATFTPLVHFLFSRDAASLCVKPKVFTPVC